MEKETENVVEEVQVEAPVQAPEEINSETAEKSIEEPNDSQSDKEYNFANLRKSKEQLENRVGELEDYIKHMATASKSSNTEDSSDFEIGDEDLAEGKHLKMMYKELQTLRSQMHEEKMANIPERLKNKFSDFEQVVSKENIDKLKKSEPELYSAIIGGNDLYAKGISAYKTLKAFGYAKENYTTQKEHLHDKHNRPISAQAIKGHGALSEKNVFAGGLTDELKKQLQKEMAEAAKSQ